MEQCSRNLSFLFCTMRMGGPSPQGFGGRVDGRVSYPARHQHTVGFSRQSLLVNKSTGACPPCWCVLGGGLLGQSKQLGLGRGEGRLRRPALKLPAGPPCQARRWALGKESPASAFPAPRFPERPLVITGAGGSPNRHSIHDRVRGASFFPRAQGKEECCRAGEGWGPGPGGTKLWSLCSKGWRWGWRLGLGRRT